MIWIGLNYVSLFVSTGLVPMTPSSANNSPPHHHLNLLHQAGNDTFTHAVHDYKCDELE